MSDKNRNMNDINDQKTAEQQAFYEEIRRRLAEPDSGKPTLEEFKVMVYKDREKRRKKRNTMVACVVAAFVVGLFSFEYFVPEVGADKNPKETIQTEDGVIIEDGGYGSSEEADNVWMTEDWEHVKDAKKGYPQLLVPSYIPPRFEFEHLVMETFETKDAVCEYKFISRESKVLEIELFFPSVKLMSLEINDVSRKINSNKGEIYLQEQEKKATIRTNDGIIISIWGDLTDQEIIAIVDELEN